MSNHAPSVLGRPEIQRPKMVTCPFCGKRSRGSLNSLPCCSQFHPWLQGLAERAQKEAAERVQEAK